jgi:hypothetical protein
MTAQKDCVIHANDILLGKKMEGLEYKTNKWHKSLEMSNLKTRWNQDVIING